MKHLHISGHAVSHKTSLAARHDLAQFVQIRDEPSLEQELHNRMTWQLAHSHRLECRQEMIATGISENDLVSIALTNLRTFAIVGIQTDMVGLAEAIRLRYGFSLLIGHVNVTKLRPARIDIAPRTLDQIEWWIDLDQKVFGTWTAMDR
jgi:hypothetical protein